MQTRSARLATLVVIGLALAFAGCGGSSPTALNTVVSSQTDADDVAVQAAIAFTNVTTIADGGLVSAQALPTAVRWGGSNAPRSAPAGFVALTSDTTFTRGDVTFELHRTFYDLAGAAQSGPDASTDSVVATSRAFGTDSTSSAQWRVTVGHAGILEAGGLNAIHDILDLGGAWSDTLTSHFSSFSGGTTVDCYAETHGVGAAIHQPKAGGYPTDGTITWSVYAQRLRNGERGSVEKTLQATVTLTFNGTRYPVVTVNGTWSYTFDLDTHVLVRAGAA